MTAKREMLGSADGLEFSQRDVTMIVALAHGISNQEIATFLGITHRAVTKWLANNKPRLKPMVDMLQGFMITNKSDIKREAIEDLLGEIKGLDTLSMQAFIDALSGNDKRLAYEASKEQRDRRLGTPKGTVSITGTVDHNLIHTIDPNVLRAFEQDVLRDSPLTERRKQMALPPSSEVIDVEPSGAD